MEQILLPAGNTGAASNSSGRLKDGAPLLSTSIAASKIGLPDQ